jgi:hypothetical protein
MKKEENVKVSDEVFNELGILIDFKEETYPQIIQQCINGYKEKKGKKK